MEETLWHSYQLYRRTLKYMFLINGIWPMENPPFLYKLFSYINVLILLFTVYGTVSCATYYLSTNLNRSLAGTCLALSQFGHMMKIVTCIAYQKDLRKLHKVLTRIANNYRDDEKLLPIMLHPVLYFKKLSFIMMTIMFAFYTFSTVIPIIIVILHTLFTKSSCQYPLPLPMKYPYTIIGGSVHYYLHYFVEGYALFTAVILVAGVDNSIAFFSSHIIGQFDVLSYKLSCMSSSSNCKGQLLAIVMRHQELLICCQTIQNIYGPIILIIIVATSVILSILIFQINQMSSITLRTLFALMAYAGVKIFQIFLYVLPASFITERNERLLDAAYSSGWEIYQNKEHRTYVLMILVQRPVCLTACHCLEMNKGLICKALNTTLSYFFILKTLEN